MRQGLFAESPLPLRAGQLHLTSLPWRRRIFARGATEDAEIREFCRGDRQVARPSVAPSFVTPIRFVHSTGDLPVAPTRIFAISAAPREQPGPRAKTTRQETAKSICDCPAHN